MPLSKTKHFVNDCCLLGDVPQTTCCSKNFYFGQRLKIEHHQNWKSTITSFCLVYQYTSSGRAGKLKAMEVSQLNIVVCWYCRRAAPPLKSSRNILWAKSQIVGYFLQRIITPLFQQHKTFVTKWVADAKSISKIVSVCLRSAHLWLPQLGWQVQGQRCGPSFKDLAKNSQNSPKFKMPVNAWRGSQTGLFYNPWAIVLHSSSAKSL